MFTLILKIILNLYLPFKLINNFPLFLMPNPQSTKLFDLEFPPQSFGVVILGLVILGLFPMKVVVVVVVMWKLHDLIYKLLAIIVRPQESPVSFYSRILYNC